MSRQDSDLQFTIDGEPFRGYARVFESDGGLLDFQASVQGRDLDLFGWTGRVLRFEGDAEYPDGTIKHVRWDILLRTGGSPKSAHFVGAGIPPEDQ
jgi:hypothetical protein